MASDGCRRLVGTAVVHGEWQKADSGAFPPGPGSVNNFDGGELGCMPLLM